MHGSGGSERLVVMGNKVVTKTPTSKPTSRLSPGLDAILTDVIKYSDDRERSRVVGQNPNLKRIEANNNTAGVGTREVVVADEVKKENRTIESVHVVQMGGVEPVERKQNN